jgi:3-deoxy-D-manno-octulosonic acid hydroxylase-like protein
MARIHYHPNVADFFVHMDWRQSRDDPFGFKTELIRNYESGKIIILNNSSFIIDYNLLNSFFLPTGRRFQKLSYKTLIYPRMYKADIAGLILAKFGRTPLFYLRLRREILRVTKQVCRFVRDVFEPYRFRKESVSWRFTSTGPEDLHVDWFRPTDDLHYVRMFINIDEQPRVWSVSHQLEELIAGNYATAGLAELGGSPSNSIIDRINNRVLNRVSYQPASETDRHVVEFAQGDVWLCETRINSHQILSGRRLVATDFYVDPSSMLDPEQRVEARVARCMERHGSSRANLH